MIPYSAVSTRPAKWRCVLVPILGLIAAWYILAGLGALWFRSVRTGPEPVIGKAYDTFGTRFLWPVCLVAYIISGWWRSRSERRERIAQERAAAGLCTVCGYDLRGGHDRCPECGHPTQHL